MCGAVHSRRPSPGGPLTTVATARLERDEAHQHAITTRHELRVERSRLKPNHRREPLALGRQIAALEDALDRLRNP